MKIVHVIPALTKGGAERVAVDLANAAVRDGHDVAMLLAYPVDPDLLQKDVDPKVVVRFVRQNRSRFGVYSSLPLWLARNRPWLMEQDIVHCHLTFGSLFGESLRHLRRWSKAERPKTIETYHAVGTSVPGPMYRLHRWLAARHDGFVTMANDERWSAFLRDRPGLAAAFIPNGIDLSGSGPSDGGARSYRESVGIPGDVPVMGTIGRLVPERRSEDLMQIFLRVAKQAPHAHFLIGGSGPERERLIGQASGAGFGDRFHFPGLVVDPPRALANIDLYLSLNVGGITGIAALEAAGQGVPVIAFQALESHPSGESDWIYSSADHDALADGALRLLSSQAERRALGKKQRQIVTDCFSSRRMFADYLHFYQRVLSR